MSHTAPRALSAPPPVCRTGSAEQPTAWRVSERCHVWRRKRTSLVVLLITHKRRARQERIKSGEVKICRTVEPREIASESVSPKDITGLLRYWQSGDREALARLVPLVIDDLHAIARGYLRREQAGHTLQATALVNELYLRLSRIKSVELADRGHFFAFAAKMMRMILIDHARQTKAVKRVGSRVRVPLHDEIAWIDAESEEMMALDGALDRMEAVDPRKVRVIELRFFLGATNEEAAQILGVSRPTVDRDLEFAKAWLYRHLTRGGGGRDAEAPSSAPSK
ncbi:MAG: sigma-70 family RNA polymerase sigma factor [Acidobacteria bacterium]|nr:sigma-70 family RNA polymerase sigma factor [Acidobacteriota bacterium]